MTFLPLLGRPLLCSLASLSFQDIDIDIGVGVASRGGEAACAVMILMMDDGWLVDDWDGTTPPDMSRSATRSSPHSSLFVSPRHGTAIVAHNCIWDE